MNKYAVLNPEGVLVLKEDAILHRANLAAEKSKKKKQIKNMKQNENEAQKQLSKKVIERPSIREIVSKESNSMVKKIYIAIPFFFCIIP